ICMWPQLAPEESRAWAFARGGAAIATSILMGILIAAMPAPAWAETGQAAAAPRHLDHTGTVRLNPGESALFSRLRCTCGCRKGEDLLSLCSCAEADDRRDMIRAKLAKGETEEQILDEYVDEFGKDALSVPPNTGALRAIYIF